MYIGEMIIYPSAPSKESGTHKLFYDTSGSVGLKWVKCQPI